jgi:glycosyltransferase involved in cell wall biosynthesis
LDDLEGHPNLKVHLFEGSSPNNFWTSKTLVNRLLRNEDGIDLLILHAMFNPPNVAIAKAARRAGIPYLVCPHDPYHPELLKKNRVRKQIYSTLFERPMIRRAAGVQVLAREHARWLDALGARAAVVVPNGFTPQPTPLRTPFASPRKWLQGDPAFLSLGRLDVHHKGLDLMIRGFASALHAGLITNQASINFVGPGTLDSAELMRLAVVQGVADHVKFHGEVSDQVRAEVFQECDAFLLCSRFDGFALVVLEAMLAGKPLLVSRQAGIAPWVDKAGAGVTADPSVDGIRDGFARLMELRPRWTVLGSNGRQYAQEHMTWDQVADRAVYVYKRILELTPSTRPANPRIPMPVIA